MWMGLTGLLCSLYFMEDIPWYYFVLSGILFGLYLLPVFLPFKKPRPYTFHKLCILILVWVMITFMMPAGNIELNDTNLLLMLYRLLLMSHLCVLFYIKDEPDPRYRQLAVNSCYIAGILQLMLCTLIGIRGETGLFFIYLPVTVLTILAGFYFNHIKRSDLHYLLFVDGIMMLQSIFVLLKYFVQHES